jgi:beta-glucanase (GH16 family)
MTIAAAGSVLARRTPPATICLNRSQYALRYDDEFTRLNAANYTFAYPWGAANPNAGDDAYYQRSQVSITSDGLTLTAEPAPSPYPTVTVSGADATLHYLSGMISTAPREEPQYGYIEAEIRIPSGRGIWPAFWTEDAYGTGAEMDIMEHTGEHTFIGQGSWTTWGSGDQSRNTPVANLRGGWHTYGVLWTPGALTYYLDGVQTVTTTNPDTVHAAYLMFSLQVGTVGSFPGAPDSATAWPQRMYVRYLRVFSETDASCGGPAPEPTPTAPPGAPVLSQAPAACTTEETCSLTKAPQRGDVLSVAVLGGAPGVVNATVRDSLDHQLTRRTVTPNCSPIGQCVAFYDELVAARLSNSVTLSNYDYQAVVYDISGARYPGRYSSNGTATEPSELATSIAQTKAHDLLLCGYSQPTANTRDVTLTFSNGNAVYDVRGDEPTIAHAWAASTAASTCTARNLNAGYSAGISGADYTYRDAPRRSR